MSVFACELRCLRERNDSRYEQFEISPETIEQELLPVDSEQTVTDRFKENYNIDYCLLVTGLLRR